MCLCMLISPVQVGITFVDSKGVTKSLQLLDCIHGHRTNSALDGGRSVYGAGLKGSIHKEEQAYCVAAYQTVKSDARHIRNRNKRWDRPTPPIPRINPTPVPCDTTEEEEVVRSTTGDASLLRGLGLAAVRIKILR